METTIFSTNDKILFMDRYTEEYQLYELDSSYLAGVIDGDGSLSCSSKYPFYIKLDIYQCDFLLIFMIMKKFNGNIKKIEKELPQRNQYCLSFTNQCASDILEFIYPNIMLKKEQCRLCIENIKILRNTENAEELESNSKKISEYNKSHNDREISNGISWEYIAGLFDAEGSISLVKSEISITQKNSESLLEKIRNFIGYGKLRKYRLIIEKKSDILDFFNNINIFLIVKKQSQYYMDYLSKRSSKYLPEKDVYRLRYKHNFDIPIEFIESLHVKREKKSYKDNVVLIKLLSEKKKGDKNPNYGVERSAEHCKKLSESTFGKHRKITNDVIKNVREEKNIKQQEIADKYNISRAQVQKIVSGKLIPTDEVYEKKQKNSRIDILIDLGYSKEEAYIISGAITKRKIEGKYMVNIWFFGKIRKNQTFNLPFKNTAKNLAQYISDKLQTDISEDMIKNIWNKKTSLYKIDFNGEIPITFEHYRENIIPDDVFFNLFA